MLRSSATSSSAILTESCVQRRSTRTSTSIRTHANMVMSASSQKTTVSLTASKKSTRTLRPFCSQATPAHSLQTLKSAHLGLNTASRITSALEFNFTINVELHTTVSTESTATKLATVLVNTKKAKGASLILLVEETQCAFSKPLSASTAIV